MTSLPTEAVERFEDGMQLASEAGEIEPTAMSLATVNLEGGASVRTVLIKSFDAQGFVFYTNTLSRKGRQLANHPSAALSVFWKSIAQQVLAEGSVEPVTEAEADAYFASRPRGSQIGAWASIQSEVLDSRETLEQRVADFENEFAGKQVSRPSHWSGYKLIPSQIEFWYGEESRLHNRFRFTLVGGDWRRERLYP